MMKPNDTGLTERDLQLARQHFRDEVADFLGTVETTPALLDRLAELSDFFLFSPAGHLVMDLNARILNANFTAGGILGEGRGEIMGKRLYPFVLREDRDILYLHLRRLFREKSPRSCEFRVMTRGNVIRHVLCRSLADQDSRGRVTARMTLLDLTDRKQAEDALRRSEEQFRCVTENIDEVFWLRTSHQMLYISPLYEKLWGKSCTSLYEDQSSFLDSIHPDDRPRIEAAFAREQSGKADFNEEYRIIQPDGSVRWVMARTFRVLTRPGERLRAGVARDITDRIRAEQRLRESEERLRLVVDAAELGTWDLNLATNNVVWNQKMHEFVGTDPDRRDITAETFFKHVDEDDLARLRKRVAECTDKRTEFRDEFRIRRADGQVQWLAAAGRAYKDDAGRPVRMAGVNYDITDRKQAEARLKESEERYRSIIHNMTEGYYEVDLKGRFLFVNEAFKDVTGYSPDEIIDRKYGEFVEPSEAERIYEQFNRVYVEGTAIPSFECLMRSKDGGETVYDASISLVIDMEGHRTGFRGVLRDITTRREKEAVRAAHERELENRVRARTAELEDRTRELSEMNALLGAEISKRKDFEAALRAEGEKVLAAYEQRDYLSRRLVDLLEKERHEIGSSLHDQIGQILTGVSMHLEELKQHGTDDASALTDRVGQIQALVRKAMKQAKRISHGLRSEVLERFGLVASIRHLINELEEQCDLKVYLFVKDIPKGFQGGKKGLAIFRLVQEGLNNIVKHAGATEVFINLAKRDGTVFLSIEDDGVGFDYNKLHEGDDVGIGPLGITIMRERISQIGGDFHVDSRPGRGTCITAEIPVTKREIEQDKK